MSSERATPYQQVFEGWLDAESSVRYYRARLDRNNRWDKGLSIATAFMASGAFTTFVSSVRDTYPAVPIVIALLAAALSVIQAGLSFKETASKLASAYEQSSTAASRWKSAWLRANQGEEPDLGELEELDALTREIMSITKSVPLDEDLADRVARETAHSFGYKVGAPADGRKQLESRTT